MEAKHLDDQSKMEFENLLFDLNGKEQIGYRKYNEFNYDKNTKEILHLYYNDQGHIGTWTKGKCWIFPDHL